MSKKILIVLAALIVAVPVSVAVADKFKTKITAQTNDDQDAIFGVVRSSNFACEKRREVRLYGPSFEFKRRGNGFERYDETLTNRFGEYDFGGFKGSLPPGDYFTRALRKDFPRDVCRRDDSNIVTVFSD